MAMPDGFRHIPSAIGAAGQRELLAAVAAVVAAAPLYTPTMPRTGRPFSVAMTSCGPLGWVSDRAGGYRYQAHHPETGAPWPPIPEPITALWHRYADCPVPPEACLVNWYAPGARLGLHRDEDENDLTAPVVSVSLGDEAWFRIGGPRRRDPSQRLLLKSGDVVVLGGASRLAFHGVDRILAGTSDLVGRPGRYNLTLRHVGVKKS